MRIIDAHLHFSDRDSLRETAQKIGHVDYSANGLSKEFVNANIVTAIVMNTVGEITSQEPLIKGGAKSLLSCVAINPIKIMDNSNELVNIEKELNNNKVVGIKIYAGYFPYYVYDPVYYQVYQLARKYSLPVAIHCGGTQSHQGLLKYSHPLTVDELAVKYRDVTFIICHLGIPWVMDTAEIISKNDNVYADVSGLIAGNENQVNKMKNTRLYTEYIQQSLVYANRYDKIIFGSDWPLVPIKPYVDFIKKIIPDKYYEQIFYQNAINVYPRINNYL